MAELRIIECEDCGCPRLTRRSNTKFCRVCRIYKNLKYLGDRVTKCIACDKTFAPIYRNEDVCASCSPDLPTGDPRGTCVICKQENASIIDQSISLCLQCAQNPKTRKPFKGALINKINGFRDGTIPYPEVHIPETKAAPKKSAWEEIPQI